MLTLETRAMKRQRLESELTKLEHKIRYNISRKMDIQTKLAKLTPKCAGEELHDAILEGDTQHVKLLLKKGSVSPNEEFDGMSPLFRAARENHPLIVDMLMRAGADPERKYTYSCDCFAQHSEKLMTALMAAVLDGHLSTVERMLANGANPNTLTRPNNGSSALMLCTSEEGPECNVMPIAEALLKAGAFPSIVANTVTGPTTALHSAAKFSDTGDIVRLLLEWNADPSIVLGGETPMDAASEENAKVLKMWANTLEAKMSDAITDTRMFPEEIVSILVECAKPIMTAQKMSVENTESDDDSDSSSSEDDDSSDDE